MPMRDLADHVIARAQGTGVGITNLQLQKVLYFTIINGIQQGLIDNEWLQENYDSEFFVWRYGPVVEEIYEEYSIYGASKIFEPRQEIEQFTNLNNIIDELLSQRVSRLVDESHSHEHWLSNENQIEFGRSNVPYHLEDLINAAQSSR
ncbi:TPA: hypothetical protein IXR49_002669 [Enterococcus faecium]|uniref:Panacea domain-containing protein n=1 Tax=Enterococcus faecium TaxID=1352 RepID=UPI00046E4324|nr:hypothetical protein [Enterococcus faecium]HAQ4312342.1 hypothetical protein [Enterococcus faecium]HAQ4321059.1 hypothetical protein [Enterococcus faecium]HAQ4395776.1 hypothetical protein [Enterococcus faecium]HAQ4451148.1 hypothetical protein [Enterococcus faecium]HAQ5013101.1 hypothetical protein [Enterococcus faecium]